MDDASSSNRTLANSYADDGWPVFPCHSPVGGGCSCGVPACSSPGKHPRTSGGFHDATTDRSVVDRWWERWPNANVGVATGRPSGLVVLDIDPRHGGLDSMRQLVGDHGRLPPGPRVLTGGGGWHVFFANPDRAIRNSVNQVGPGIDIRAEGGYVIAPPSLHSAGDRYVWTSHGAPPKMPEWLEHLAGPVRSAPHAITRTIPISTSLNKWAAAAMRGEAARVRTAPEGCRNHTLNRAAFALGQIAGTGIIESSEVQTLLRDAAIGAGLGEREATLTIRSGIAAGLARPRGPSANEPRDHPPAPDVDLELGLP